jgi:hypothetical protein
MERRAILLHKDHPALLRARRRRLRWGAREHRLYAQHRDRVEGIHGEAKTWHGLARAIRRGMANMQIQAYLTAAVINLKRLAAAFIALILTLVHAHRRPIAHDRVFCRARCPPRPPPRHRITLAFKVGFFNKPAGLV